MMQAKQTIYWGDTEPVEPEPPLSENVQCDVCIVGGGFTGLWTAHFLIEAEPSLDVRIVESKWAGAGASGQNDGFASTRLDMSHHDLVHHVGAERAAAAHRAAARSIGEIVRFCETHAIDAELEPNGSASVAVNPGQVWRLERDYEAVQRMGVGEAFEWMDADKAREMIGSPALRAALKDVRTVLLNPHKLVRGLARLLRDRGVTIYGRSRATEIGQSARKPRVVTATGSVAARSVVVATNAHQHAFPSFRTKVLPIWTYALVSEPLSREQLSRVRWPGREGFEDKRNFATIGRLTSGDRILWAGRGAPYFYGNNMDTKHIHNARVHGQLRRAFHEFFPVWRDVSFAYAWGGCAAITASSLPYFGTLGGGVYYAYGYNGHGIPLTHTGGKILRDLVLGRESEHTELAFVNGKEPKIPPEPFRFVGARLASRLLDRQDRRFDRGRGVAEKSPLLVRMLR